MVWCQKKIASTKLGTAVFQKDKSVADLCTIKWHHSLLPLCPLLLEGNSFMDLAIEGFPMWTSTSALLVLTRDWHFEVGTRFSLLWLRLCWKPLHFSLFPDACHGALSSGSESQKLSLDHSLTLARGIWDLSLVALSRWLDNTKYIQGTPTNQPNKTMSFFKLYNG